ncbi:MAG: N-acetylglucosamine kinase, partial [Acetobacter okinawensis]
TPTVLALAHAQDPHAVALLQAAGTHLAALARTACKALPPGQTAPDMPWSYGGSVLHSLFIRDHVATLLGQAAVSPALPPLGGAALRAAHLAGWKVDTAWVDRLRQTLSPQTLQNALS